MDCRIAVVAGPTPAGPDSFGSLSFEELGVRLARVVMYYNVMAGCAGSDSDNIALCIMYLRRSGIGR